MALSSTRQKIQNLFSISFEFDGVLQAYIRGHLAVDLIKYFLFQRQQIPMTFDHLAADIKCEEQKEMGSLSCQGSKLQARPKIKSRAQREMKKKKETVEAMDKLFRILLEIFSGGAHIRQLAVLFGSTIVSPKEIVVMNFPTAFYEGPVLTHRQCMTKVFHKLVSEDFLGESGTMKSIRKMSVMVLQQRDCDIAHRHLIPKLNFKLPTRGKKFELNFACHHNVNRSNGELSIMDETTFDISGIEPLNKTLDKSIDHGTPTKSFCAFDCRISESVTEISGVDYEQDNVFEKTAPMLNCEHEQASFICDSLDYIWYQLPVTVTGFKDKTSVKLTSTGDLMM